MKTKKQVLQENEDYKTIINAVINKVGKDSIDDINNHGIDGGFNGFIYYYDTHNFAIKHRKTIIKMLNEDADDFGQEVVEMVSGFGIFRNKPMDAEDRQELYCFLGGGKCKQSTITNLMAGYAAEKVCRMFEE